ncbi:replication initiation protein RepC [Sulfitobacter dubius]|nr:replication initiation protein RepC [Sulfitobacter dubius]
MRRDLAGFVAYGLSLKPELALWDRMSDLSVLTARDLRRRLSFEDLNVLKAKMIAALEEVKTCIDAPQSDNMSTSDANIEQHHQSSNKEYIDNREEAATGANEAPTVSHRSPHQAPPIKLVLSTCKEIQTFAPGSVRHWDDLVSLSDAVSPMMGISRQVWKEAQSRMGTAQAATTLAAMLERFAEIKSPSAYLRSLTQKAENGLFSCGAMIRALQVRPGVSSQL